jgi:hypothetical protein
VAGAEQDLRKAAEQLRASVALADVAAPDGARHDPERLAAAFREIFTVAERPGYRGVVPPERHGTGEQY